MLDASSELFSKPLMRASKRVANTHGVSILPTLMKRAEGWGGEEGLLYLPLVLMLPREHTVQILKSYAAVGSRRQRIWAREFLYEIKSSDEQLQDADGSVSARSA